MGPLLLLKKHAWEGKERQLVLTRSLFSQELMESSPKAWPFPQGNIDYSEGWCLPWPNYLPLCPTSIPCHLRATPDQASNTGNFGREPISKPQQLHLPYKEYPLEIYSLSIVQMHSKIQQRVLKVQSASYCVSNSIAKCRSLASQDTLRSLRRHVFL